MRQGRQPDGRGLAALAAWASLNPADYVKIADKPNHAETLAVISTALRGDSGLSAEAAEAIDIMVQSAYERLRSR